MEPAQPNTKPFSVNVWLIIIIASIGFLFDTYELLMTPLVAAPAISQLLDVPLSNPLINLWVGRLLWISALCGGIFGLMGGWLVDRFGRKTIMAASIFLYSFSPFAAAYATSLPMFVFFRSTTFIGVCVEFVAAITWLAEVFEDKKQKERWLGITQAFASVGGVLVTWASSLISHHWGAADPNTWRYLLMTGMLPAIPIALLLPFVPESKVWKERRSSGTLKRPSFAALFAPELRRVTLVTAALSACAYGIAFGALQVTVAQVTPGLPELAVHSKPMIPLKKQADALNQKLNDFDKSPNASKDSPKRKELVEQIAKNTKEQNEYKIKDSSGKETSYLGEVKKKRDTVQFFQEMGGLVGRIILALLLIIGIGRIKLLRVFQIPALVVLPVTYFILFSQGGSLFLWAYGACGLLVVAQFSYFGEYLPKVFPLHLRGTGGSFATNVGGRMIGTSMALVTTNIIAPMFADATGIVKPANVAMAAGCVATGIAVLAFILSFVLPEPPKEEMKEA